MLASAADPAVTWLARLLDLGREPAFRPLLRMLISLGWMQRRRMVPALLAAVLLSGLALVPPALLAHLIDNVFPSKTVAAVVALGAALFGIAIVDAACSFLRRMLAVCAALNLRRCILQPAFAAMLRLPMDSRQARDQGLLGRTFEEVERLAQGASEGLLELALGAGTICVLAAAMLIVNPQVGLIVLAIVIALAVMHVALARSLRAREARWFETRSRYWSHLVEAIAYINTLRFNSAHDFAERRFAERLGREVDANLAVATISAGLDSAGRLTSGLITAAIALFGGLRVIDGGMSIGDFVLFLSVGGSLSVPVLGLVKTFDDFQALAISTARLADLIHAPHEAMSSAPPSPKKGPARLSVSGLVFAYEMDGAPLLQDFSCTLDPAERVALVGPSGVGKSTLASLLFATRRPLDGVVALDGVAIEKIPLAELRQRIVVVPHEIDIFTGSVGENIALGLPQVTIEDITKVAAIAAIDEDIRALPQGYDTLLGQGGLDLSAGQKQRLGIARALLREPDILILDESTSSLDLATERRVIDGLLRYLANTTILAITHRASVVERMQRAIDI